jgi:hypothetical protein
MHSRQLSAKNRRSSNQLDKTWQRTCINWVICYNCHRNGAKQINKGSAPNIAQEEVLETNDNDNNTPSKKPRKVLKASKKIGCTAKLHATNFIDNPHKIIITSHGTHNHVVGSLEDMSHLNISPELKMYVLEKFRAGYDISGWPSSVTIGRPTI